MSDYKCPHCVHGPVYTDTDDLLDHCRVRHRDKTLSLLVRTVSLSEKSRNPSYVRKNYETPIRSLLGRHVSIDDQLELRWGGTVSRDSTLSRTGSLPGLTRTKRYRPSILREGSGDNPWKPVRLDTGSIPTIQSDMGSLVANLSTEATEAHKAAHASVGNDTDTDRTPIDSQHTPQSNHGHAVDIPRGTRPDDDRARHDVNNEQHDVTSSNKGRARDGSASAKSEPDSAESGPDSVQYGPDSAEYGPDSAEYGPDSAEYGPDSAEYGPDSAGGRHNANTNTDDDAASVSAVDTKRHDDGDNENTERAGDKHNKHGDAVPSTQLPRSDGEISAELSDLNQPETHPALANNTKRKLQTYEAFIKRNTNKGVVTSETLPLRAAGGVTEQMIFRHNAYGASIRRQVAKEPTRRNNTGRDTDHNINNTRNSNNTENNKTESYIQAIDPHQDPHQAQKMGSVHSEHEKGHPAGHDHGGTEPVRGILDHSHVLRINNRYSTGALLDIQRATHGQDSNNEGSITGNMNMFLATHGPFVKQFAADDIHIGRTLKMSDNKAIETFRRFCTTDIYNDVIKTFEELRTLVGVHPGRSRDIYDAVKQHVVCPEAMKFFRLLDARKAQEVYGGGTIGHNTTVLVVGGGPCGLRTAIECAMLGCRVIVVEMRNYATRCNVLHLWPTAANDLKVIGAKVFYPKFCAGAIHHISIRRIQLVLMKIALLLGVDIHSPVTFEDVIQPSNAKDGRWRARVSPSDCPVNNMDFDVIVGADGKKNSLDFPRKFTRGKVSIAITANFKNPGKGVHTRVSEIPGVISVKRPDLFSELKDKSGLEFENFVYFRDETHYFIMTAKKTSIIDNGIVRKETADLKAMFHPSNINQAKLLSSVRSIAEAAWRVDNPSLSELPELEFELDRYGKEDVAIFDFAALYQAEHACMIKERCGKKLLQCIVGDTLLEPFWPTGSGIAKGFLGVLDAAWTIRHWAMGHMTDLEVIAERESLFRVLPQVTPDSLNRNNNCTIDPRTRYNGGVFRERLPLDTVKPKDVEHLYTTSDRTKRKAGNSVHDMPKEKRRLYRGGSIDTHRLVSWYKEKLQPFAYLCPVTDLAKSWNNGLALSALIQSERPDLMDVQCLDPNDCRGNIQRAFEVMEREFGVEQMMTPDDLASNDHPDRLTMMSYLFHVYEYMITKDDDKVAQDGDTEVNIPRNPSAYSLINTVANSDVLLSTLRRDARHIQTLDFSRLAQAATLDPTGGLNRCLKSATLGRKAKNKMMAAVRRSKTSKPNQAVGRELRKKTRDRMKRPDAGQNYENVELSRKPVLPKIQSMQKNSNENNELAVAQNGVPRPTAAPRSNIRNEKTSNDNNELAIAQNGVLRPTPVPRSNIRDEGDGQQRSIMFSENSKTDDGPTHELAQEEESTRKKQMSFSREACGGVVSGRINAFRALSNTKENTPPISLVSRSHAFRGTQDLNEESAVGALKRRSAIRKESSINISDAPTEQRKRTGDLCCLCDKKLYIVERFCAHGQFLHRSCFTCKTCGTNLRIGNNVYIPDEDGHPQFYCCAHAYQAGANNVNWEGQQNTGPTDYNTITDTHGGNYFGPITAEERQYMVSDEDEDDDSGSDIDDVYHTNLGLPGCTGTLTLNLPTDTVPDDLSDPEDWQSDVTDTSLVLLEQDEIQQGLDDVEIQREQLEVKGIELEKQIRCEAGDHISRADEDLMDAWLNVAHEKKELKEKEAKLMLKLRLMDLQERLAAMLDTMAGIDDGETDTMEEEVIKMETATDHMEKAAMEDDLSQMIHQMVQMQVFLGHSSSSST